MSRAARLPLELLKKRVQNELSQVKERYEIECPDKEISEIPITIKIGIENVPGLCMEGSDIKSRSNHHFEVQIDEEYPYKRPVVRWLTPIFHPNIQDPSEGGLVCTRSLATWNFQSNLLSLAQGIELLIRNPSPENALGCRSCIEAARYYSEN